MLTLIIKPTHICNLNCTYCYDRPNREKDKSKMSFETVENIFKIARTKTDSVNIIWHGGEPLLMGLEWYRYIYETIIPKYFEFDKITSSYQTNGTIFDPYFLAFTEKYSISLGMSYDGITNNQTRHNTEKLKENKLKAEACDYLGGWRHYLMVVTPDNAYTLINSYKESLDEDFTLEFSEVFSEQSEGEAINELDVILTAYKEFFRYFVVEVPRRELPRPFRFYVNHVLGNRIEGICENINCTGQWLGIHPDGTTYPCGRDWKELYTYGNINEMEAFDDVKNSEGFNLMKQGEAFIENHCKACELNVVCNGGCPNTRTLTSGSLIVHNESQCIFAKGMVRLIEDVLLELKAYEVINADMLVRISESNYTSYKDIKEAILKRREKHVRSN